MWCKGVGIAGRSEKQGKYLAQHELESMDVIRVIVAGSFGTPAQTTASNCLPAQLVAIGQALQLQTSSAPTDLQTPFPPHQTRSALCVWPCTAHPPGLPHPLSSDRV